MAPFNPSDAAARPTLSRAPPSYSQKLPTRAAITSLESDIDAVLELSDGSAYQGISFGAEGKSIAGECVFQTGKENPSVPFFLFFTKKNRCRNGWLRIFVNRSFI